MHYQQVAILCTVLVLTVSLGDSFRLFGGGGSGTPDGTSALGKNVRLLVRKVDQPDPYYRSMNFFVPAELNYMLGEYLFEEFSTMLSKHCNVTNITMLVRNDLQLMQSDYDVWKLRDGDRIEIWAKKSGQPTRADTAKAFVKKYSGRPGGRPVVRPPGCPMGRPCGNFSGFSTVEEGVPMPDDSAKVEVAAGAEDAPTPASAGSDGAEPGPGDEPIVVPDWSQMPS